MDNKLSIKTKKHAHVLNFAGPLQNLSEVQGRDKTQSRRLHEPTSIHSHTDPITGHDVFGDLGHPFVKDGILTVYFESEDTRRKYLDMPVNHPVRILNNVVTADDDRGG
jgi:hypothetical protein